MRHFAHNIGDYAAATRHLSFVEDAAYRRLLDRYYQDEKPLPAEMDSCFRLCGARTKEERRAVANVLGEFFILEADGYHQNRADREIEVYQAKAKAARENGTKGGRPVNREKTKTVSAQVRSEKATTPHSPLPTNNEEEEMPNGIVASATAEDATRAFWMFNDSAKRTGWPAVQKLDPDRKKAMLARLKDVGGVEGFAIALGKAEASEFLTTGWPNFNLDWMLKPKNFRKLMEGNYDNRHREDPNARSLSAGLAGIFEAGSR